MVELTIVEAWENAVGDVECIVEVTDDTGRMLSREAVTVDGILASVDLEGNEVFAAPVDDEVRTALRAKFARYFEVPDMKVLTERKSLLETKVL